MQFVDAVALRGARETQDGYLVADARVARTGIQVYLGSEVGKPEMPTVRVYRPADQVFARDSLASYAHKPMTNDHPADGVDAANWRALAVGHIGDEIARDGDFVRVPLIVMDKTAIGDIMAGKRELSAGYTCDLAFDAGQTAAGEDYDAVQKDIRVNHVAIVQRGRAGSQARIGDGAVSWGAAPISDHAERKESPMADNLRKVLVDGLQVETTDAGATAIEKLTRDKAELGAKLTDANAALDATKAAHAAAIAKKDEEIGALKIDLQKAKDAAPKATDLDKLVADRVALITTAKAIHADLRPEGLSDADIRQQVVTAKMGDEAVKDASEAEITGMFKALARDVKPADPMRAAFLGREPLATNDAAAAAYTKMVQDMQTAHLPKNAA